MRKSKYSIGKIRNKKMFFLLVVLGLVIGFATVATTLKINGFTLIKKNTWDIRWDRDSIVLSEDMPAGTTLPTVSTSASGTTDDTVTFSTDLTLPGDFYEFYIDAVNNGTVNGEISSVTTTWKKNGSVITTLPDYLKYTVVYADTEEEPKQGDVLLKEHSRTYRVRLEFKEEATTLAGENANYSAEIAITYGIGPDVDEPTEGGPGIAQLEEEAQDSPSTNPEETVNPVRMTRAPVTNDNTGGEAIDEGETLSYMGEEPNNFIYFNCDSLDQQDSDHCELWRVMGTDKDNGNRIKIIRNDYIVDSEHTDGKFAWNTDTTSEMTNYWPNSSLKEYLNTTYYNSLSEVSQKLIPTVTWYTTGGYNVLRLNAKNSWYGDQWSGMTAASAYVNERTKFVTDNPNFQRSNVQAKVGLMYASDYGYAAASCYSECTSTGGYPCRFADDFHCEEFQTNDFIDLRRYNTTSCLNSNWLYAGIEEWTMTATMENAYNSTEGWYLNYKGNSYYWNGTNQWGDKIAQGSQYCLDPNRERKAATVYPDKNLAQYHEDYKGVFYIEASYNGRTGEPDVENGGLDHKTTEWTAKVRPVVYLKSGVDLTGTGSRSDPYKIVADASVLNGDDSSSSGGSSTPTVVPDITKPSQTPSCGDSKAPSCKLNYVKEVATGFEYSFNCTDNVEINRIVSNFSANPSGENYGARTFEQVGLIRNGQVINNGKTKSYAGKWTILSKPAAKKGINYYFTYGGEDKCGNWVLYTTPTSYSFGT